MGAVMGSGGMGSGGLFLFALRSAMCRALWAAQAASERAGRFPLKLILYLLSLDTGG